MQNSILVLALLLGTTSVVADTIHPKGDENLGILVLKEPKWNSPAQTNILPYSIVTRTGALQSGIANRLLDGKYRLQLVTDGFLNVDYADVTVTKKTTTEYLLSGLVLHYDTGTKATWTTDIGPRAKLTIQRDGQPLYPSNKTVAWTGNNDRGMVVLPGKYVFSWSVAALDKIETEIRPGDAAVLDITPPDRRGTLLLVPPAGKEFSTPTGATCYARANKPTLEYREAPTHTPEQLKLADLTKKKELKAYPSTGEYNLELNGLMEVFKMESGRTTEIALRRIDVDRVEVTNEQGQTSFVNGTYRVDQKQKEGTWKQALIASDRACGEFPTQTGLDVPRGEYRISVSYHTAEGLKKDVHLLDLR